MSDSEVERTRLESWKQIAAHLNKSERTVRRWHESEGLPVHRHQHQQKGSVWAYPDELQVWLSSRTLRPEVPETPPETALYARGRPQWLWLAGVGAGTGLLAVLLLFLRRPSPPIVHPDPVPLTALPGTEHAPSMSPDGKRVAFYWSQPAQPSNGIYVKEVGHDTVTPLAVAPRGKGFLYNPAWSPDGGTIAFLERNPSGETWLCLIPAIGGQHRRIKQIAAPPVIYFGNYAHLAWNRDSRGIIVPMGVGAQQGIYQISVDSGAAISIVKGAPLYSPALSPNGRRLAYFRHEGLPITSEDLLLQELNSDGSASGSPKLLHRTTGASGIAWLPDSKHLALCAGGPTLLGAVEGRLLQLSANPGEAAKEILGGLGCVTIALAPDGSLVYGVRSKPQSKMLRADLRSAEPAAEFLPSSRYDSFPSFSPDGEHIAFYSNRSGKGEIWLARKDGTEVHRAAEGLQADSGPVWSPNSDRIVYVSGTALTIANRGGGALVKIDLAGAVAQHPVWSTDGRSIYYAGKSHLWKVRTDGTGREALGELPPILELHASPDGRHLYYLRPGKAFALCRIPTGGGPEEIVQDGLALPSFSLREDAVCYVRRGMMLYSQPLPGGPEKKVGLLPIDINATGQQWDTRFTISPDSSTVIWILSAPQEVDLAMQKFPIAR